MKHYETGCEWPNKQNTPQLYPHTHILADSYMYMYIQEGEKTHRRETHRRETHRRETHRRETHRRKTHRRETHRRKTHRRETHRRETHRRETHAPANTTFIVRQLLITGN